MKSLRGTLTLSVSIGVCLAAVVAGSVLYSRVRTSMLEQFDAAGAAKARSLGTQLDGEGDRVEFAWVPGLMPEFERIERPEYFQLSNTLGDVLDRSETLKGQEIEIRFGPTERPAAWDLELPDGRAGRAVGIVIAIAPVKARADMDHDGPQVVVVVARGREEIDSALAAVRGALVVAGAVLLAAVLLVVSFTVRRGLRPLVALAREVERIDASCLASRVTRDGLPVELEPTAVKLNELLERVETAFARERRMTGNIAHELRTPIAELRTAVDVARRWPEDVALRDAAIETANAVSHRMGELVVGLLRLARISSGSDELELEDVDLRELVDAAWHAVEPSATERGLRLEHRTPHGLLLRTDRALLAIVVSNLLDNAVRFAQRDSAVECAVERERPGTHVTWTVANRTSGVTTDDLRHLTEPFWQRNGSRSDGAHAGLGLTLVSATTAALGAELDFRLDDAFTVAITLPLASPPPVSLP